MDDDIKIRERAINTIRFLSADAIQNANSGHPGLPMGTAALAYTIWTRHLRFNPRNPSWPDRDRFVLSGGHGSMLLYSLLYLTGYDVSLDDIKRFRQWDSITPGHPEYGVTPGVETTTGPLGQGFSNGVGMAIAAAHLGALFNTADHDIVTARIFGIVTDGDLMEGVASEAASLAGHLRLGNIIYLYDDNRISIDGSTEITFTEDRSKRFDAYGWHVSHVSDGNDVDEIDEAINDATNDPRPSIIVCRTHIGFGLPTRQDTAKAHGEPPGEEELRGAKEKLGWPVEPKFIVPEDVLAFYRTAVDRGEAIEKAWKESFETYRETNPEEASELLRRFSADLPDGWDDDLPIFEADNKGMATRVSNGRVINALAQSLPELLGGSADLTGSTKTWIENSSDFQADQYDGRNFYFGVREHGMGAIVNGMALFGGIIPFGATFLVFSDYMRGAVRVSALSHIPSIWIFTHDSIGLGEDGPTHQPVEQLAALRAIPNLAVIRPADANEVTHAWRAAILRRDKPTALVFTRQAIPTFDRTNLASAEGTLKGAYVLAEFGEVPADVILMATGSEVQLITAAGERLAEDGFSVRVVSFPSWELFADQDETYRESVLSPDVTRRLAVEAGVRLGWDRWVGQAGDVISLERYGGSAPGDELFEKFGFTADEVVKRAKRMLA